MSSKSRIGDLWLAMVTGIVLLGPIAAQAQMSCQSLFSSQSSVYRENFLPLKNLNNSAQDLLSILITKPQETDIVTVFTKIDQVQVNAEIYFKAAGISFDKVASSITVKNLLDAPEITIPYSLYRLSGSAKGDEFARLFYGAQSNPRHKDLDLKVIFDIMYLLKSPQSNGHFDGPSRALFIGPHVLTQEVAGISSTLRHEIQHYFEQVKMLMGKMTLARMSLEQIEGVSTDPYAAFLRTDEIETHVRDIRLLLNTNLLNAKDSKLAKTEISPEALASFPQLRRNSVNDRFLRLEMLIQKSLTTISHIEGALQKKQGAVGVTTNSQTGAVEVKFSLLPPPYSFAKVELVGLVAPESAKDFPKIAENLLQVIEWNRKRILVIEKELQSMKPKLPRD